MFNTRLYKILLIIITFNLIIYSVVFNDTANLFFIKKYTYLNFINKTQFNLFNTIYISILFTLLVLIILNRFIIKKYPLLLIIFYLFIIIIYVLIYTNSIFVFFLMYELLLLITSIIVYYSSANIRSKTITIYFVLWTQLSSLLLWITIILIYKNTNSYLFSDILLTNFTNQDKIIIKLLLIISFSIKLPLWPFSFWLIKTHVEANTSFSIFLSGVLIKTALVGLLKFQIFLTDSSNNFILLIIVISLICTTFALSHQIDFKKLIAYTTVQEMSLLLLFIFYQGIINLYLIKYYIIYHTLMSLLLFLLNDSIYIRFKTRKTKLFLGLSTITPKLNLIFILVWVIFISIPLSIKFVLELSLLFKLMSYNNIILFSILFILQFLTLVFFTNNIITYSFGNNFYTTLDLTKNELIVYTLTITLVIILIF